MSLVIEHLEYLLLRHDCVTLPGIGAILVRYQAARFAPADEYLMLPPSRQLAFNAALSESDGLLESSVSRKSGVSFEVARDMVADDIASLRAQLMEYGRIPLGRLGFLNATESGTITFEPADVARWDFTYFGLKPIKLRGIVSNRDVNNTSEPVILPAIEAHTPDGDMPDSAEPTTRPSRRSFARIAVDIAASVAILLTLALFFWNPIHVSDEPVKASIAPVETAVKPAENSQTIAAESATDAEDIPAATDAVENVVTTTEQSTATTAEQPAALTAEKSVAQTAKKPVAKKEIPSKPTSIRFNENDAFCVIVASLPTEELAHRYIAEHPGRNLGILPQDGKFRVYGATSESYDDASAQKAKLGVAGAWICRR